MEGGYPKWAMWLFGCVASASVSCALVLGFDELSEAIPDAGGALPDVAPPDAGPEACQVIARPASIAVAPKTTYFAMSSLRFLPDGDAGPPGLNLDCKVTQRRSTPARRARSARAPASAP